MRTIKYKIAIFSLMVVVFFVLEIVLSLAIEKMEKQTTVVIETPTVTIEPMSTYSSISAITLYPKDEDSDEVTFSVYEQEKPTNVLFLMGGIATSDNYWFRDLTIFENNKHTLCIGVKQSDNLIKDLELIIDWVKNNYDFQQKEQWSFYGFSMGAYKCFDTAMEYFHSTFGNYCAIGGGFPSQLQVDPNICFIYVAYGIADVDSGSADYAIKVIKEKGFINENNFKFEVIPNQGHSLEEATIGLSNFLNELNIRYPE